MNKETMREIIETQAEHMEHQRDTITDLRHELGKFEEVNHILYTLRDVLQAHNHSLHMELSELQWRFDEAQELLDEKQSIITSLLDTVTELQRARALEC